MTMLTIVTGASSNHFRCLRNLLDSIQRFEPTTRTIVYDLGLSPAELRELRAYEVRHFAYNQIP